MKSGNKEGRTPYGSLKVIRNFSNPDNIPPPLIDGGIFHDLIPPRLSDLISHPLAICVITVNAGKLGVGLSVIDTSNNEEALKLHLSTFPDTPQSLHIWDIQVAEALRQHGVARSFYQNLAPLARVENFRYITGEQRPQNRRIFQRLGRIPYGKLSEISKRKIFSKWLTSIDDPDSYMETVSGLSVEFLYEEDKDVIVKHT